MESTSARECTATRFPRLCVSAVSGGGGKTLLSLGLARAFRQAGLEVKPFKKGPDYIDAAWLGRAAGRPATNLDPFFLADSELAALFAKSLGEDLQGRAGQVQRLGLIEGNRGLYDGLDAAGSCSTARLARALAAPVLLCLDATKMTRTAAALLSGILNFEPGLNICGVVFNRVGSIRHEAALRQAVEAHLDLPVLGILPRLGLNPLPERHMGLASQGTGLTAQVDALLDKLSSLVRENVDLEAVLAKASYAPPLPGQEDAASKEISPQACLSEVSLAEVSLAEVSLAQVNSAHGISASGQERSPACAAHAAPRRPRIGYLRDAAFWFYYPENLAALAKAGADLVPLALIDAPKAQDAIWETLDGLYLGGGFPEDFLEQLSGSPQVAHLAELTRSGLPIYAECGGLLLLSRGMEREGKFWPLAGALPVRAVWTARPQGLGYVEAEVCAENPFFPLGLRLRGHEFHYSRCILEPDAPPPALALSRGSGMGSACPQGETCSLARDGLFLRQTWGAYLHIFAPAVPCWAPNFVACASAWQIRRKQEER